VGGETPVANMRKRLSKKQEVVKPKPAETLTQKFEHGLQIGLRASLASLLAAWAALRLGMDYPIYAVIAAIVVTDSNPDVTRKMGFARLVGNLIGACLGALFGTFLGHGALAMAGGVLFSILFTDLIGLRDTQRITAYITGIVILFHGDSPWLYAKDRFIETSIGLFFAVLVSMAMEVVMKKMKVKF
jgi:uncharacterized membrane protein YgaE (UPF0421/DUF939 family)